VPLAGAAAVPMEHSAEVIAREINRRDLSMRLSPIIDLWFIFVNAVNGYRLVGHVNTRRNRRGIERPESRSERQHTELSPEAFAVPESTRTIITDASSP